MRSPFSRSPFTSRSGNKSTLESKLPESKLPESKLPEGKPTHDVGSALEVRADGPVLLPTPVEYPPQSRHDSHDGLCFTVDHVLATNECERLIALTEVAGYEQALVNVGGGRQVSMLDLRRSQRCILDSREAADLIWQRLAPLVPARPGWAPVGLNERLRFLKYGVGDYFAPHQDGRYVQERGSGAIRPGDASHCTVMLYLNDPERGGATSFLNPMDETQRTAVAPRAGLGLVFDHALYHEGNPLEAGVKYALRTDIMFRRVTASSLAAEVPRVG